jgi:hypothetical protein
MPENPTALRHLVEWNLGVFDQARFFWRDCARQSRIVTIDEYGPASYRADWQFPASLALASAVPTGAQFGLADDTGTEFAGALKLLLGGARPLLALGLGAIVNADRWAALLARTVPDMVWAPTPPADLPPALAPHRPLADTARWGMPREGWYSTQAADRIVHAVTLAFESRWLTRATVGDQVYDIADVIRIAGVYPVEREGADEWCWTGPDPHAVLLIPSHGGAEVMITIFLYGSKLPLSAEHLRVIVDGRAWPTRFVPDELKIEIRFKPAGPRACHRLEIIQCDLWRTPDGSRQLGLALHKLRLTIVS